MRRICYVVATSLDGFIAGPAGEADWIIMDPEIDFRQLYKRFDTILVGRKTFEPMASHDSPSMSGMKTVVFSRTLKQSDYPNVTMVAENYSDAVAALRDEPGKDIWLFGGGLLFRSLADAGLVDTVEVAVIPVLLGEGIPLISSPANQIKLRLTGHRVYESSGIVGLEYAIK